MIQFRFGLDGVPRLGTTLAPLVQAWFDRWGLSDVDDAGARELRAMLKNAQNFNVFPDQKWAEMSPEDRISSVLCALKSARTPVAFYD